MPKRTWRNPQAAGSWFATKLLKAGVTDMIRISDARMSDTAYGPVILRVAPEAAAGGVLSIVWDDDVIELDVQDRLSDIEMSDEEIEKWLVLWQAPISPAARYRKLYCDLVLQADAGADLDFPVERSENATHAPHIESSIHLERSRCV
jgi:dihydroxy-acid dehydratase